MITDDKAPKELESNSSETSLKVIFGEEKINRKLRKREVVLKNKSQQELLKQYYFFKKSNDNALTTILTQIKIIKYFCGFIGNKDLRKVTRKDIENFIYESQKANLSAGTINIYKITLRCFYSWLLKAKKGTYPKVVEWIQRSQIKSKEKEILTQEEIKKLLKCTSGTRDRCLISVLYDGAFRIGEITGVKLKDIESDGYGFKIKVTGKTGTRTIRLSDSVAILRQWLNEHPFKEDSNAYLFICQGRKYGYALSSHGGYKVIEAVAKKSKITKKIHPHIFRHSKLTHLAQQGFNEMDLRVFAGWSRKSNMPEVYIHTSQDDVDRKIRNKNGMVSKEEEEKLKNLHRELKPRVCFTCDTLNDVNNKFCSKCGAILDSKIIKDIEKAKESVFSMITEEQKKKLFNDLKSQFLVEILKEVQKK